MLGISALCLVLFSQLELFLIFFVLSSWTILIGSLYSWIFGVPSAMKMGYPQYPLINMNGLSSFPAMISNMLNYIMMWNVFFLGTISPQFPTNPIFSGDFELDKLPIPFSAAILELISYPSQPCSGLVPGAEKHRDNVGVLRPKSGRGVMRDVLGMFDEFWDKVKWRYATNLGVQFH